MEQLRHLALIALNGVNFFSVLLIVLNASLVMYLYAFLLTYSSSESFLVLPTLP